MKTSSRNRIRDGNPLVTGDGGRDRTSLEAETETEPLQRPSAEAETEARPLWRLLTGAEMETGPHRRPSVKAETEAGPLRMKVTEAEMGAHWRPASKTTCPHAGPKRIRELDHRELRRQGWLSTRPSQAEAEAWGCCSSTEANCTGRSLG